MKIKYNKNNLICCLLIIPFIEPLLFKYEPYTIVDKFYTIAKIISFLTIVFITIVKKVKIHKVVYVIGIYEFILGLSTLLNHGNIVQYCGPAVNVLGLTLIVNYYFPKIKLDFIKEMYLILFVLVLINTFCVVFFPNGLVKQYALIAPVNFLGIENRYVFFMLPLLFYAAIYSILKYKKFNWVFYFVAFIILFTLIKVWSVGAMLGMLLLIILMLLVSAGDKKNFIKKIDFKYYFLFIVFLNIALVVFNAHKLIEPFIVNVLHKDITLSGRTLIWANAIELFKKHFLFGVGEQPKSYFRGLFYGAAHPHNLFLSILLFSGVLGFIMYLILFYMINKSNKKIKNFRIKFIINISLLTLLFMALADTIDTGLIFTMYLVAILYPDVMEKESDRD